MAIQLKRGDKADLPATAEEGRPLVTLDTKELYIGTGSGISPVKIDNTNVIGLGTAATHPTSDFEAALGNPASNGQVLSSTTAGTRSWIDPPGGTPYATNPTMDGVASPGAVTEYSRGDHVHPSDTSRVSTSTTVNGHALSSNVTVTKGDVGLGNVDNTSDLDKPISTATQTALDAKVPTTRQVNGHALSADVTVTKGDVGLGNCDNTADVDKPVSTAQQTALDAKVDKTTTVNGHALSANVSVTKGDVGLSNVTNDVQAKAADVDINPTSSKIAQRDASASLKAFSFIRSSLSSGPGLDYIEDFLAGTGGMYTSANIGSPTGHYIGVGTVINDANRPGILRLYSGTAGSGIGVACYLNYGSTSGPFAALNGALGWLYETTIQIDRLPSAGSGTGGNYQAGLASTKVQSPWTDGVGFILSTANTNKDNFYIRYGTTSVDTGVTAVANTWYRLTIVSDGVNVNFYINGVSVGTVAASSLPNGQMAASYTSVPSSAVGSNLYIDYVQMQRNVVR